MQPRTRRSVLAAVLVVLLGLALAGCGSSASTAPTASPTTEPTATGDTSPTPDKPIVPAADLPKGFPSDVVPVVGTQVVDSGPGTPADASAPGWWVDVVPLGDNSQDAFDNAAFTLIDDAGFKAESDVIGALLELSGHGYYVQVQATEADNGPRVRYIVSTEPIKAPDFEPEP